MDSLTGFILLFNFLSELDNSRITPKRHFKPPGESVKIRCNSAVKIKWYFEGSTDLPINVEVMDRYTLLINNIDDDSSGVYECAGLNGDNNKYFYAVCKVLLLGMLCNPLHQIFRNCDYNYC